MDDGLRNYKSLTRRELDGFAPHSIGEGLSIGAPVLHPIEEDLSMGVRVFKIDEELAADDVKKLIVFVVLMPVVLASMNPTRTTESLTLQSV